MKILIIILTLAGEPDANPAMRIDQVRNCPTAAELAILEGKLEQEAAAAGLAVNAKARCYAGGRALIF